MPAESPEIRTDETHRKVAVLSALLVSILVVVAAVGAFAVNTVRDDTENLVLGDGATLIQAGEIQAQVRVTQLALEQATGTETTDTTRAQLDAFDAAIDEFLNLWGSASTEVRAIAPPDDVVQRWGEEVLRVRGELEFGDAGAASLDSARDAYQAVVDGFDDGITPLDAQVNEASLDAVDQAELVRNVLLVVALTGLVVGLGASRWTYRAVYRQHRAISRQNAERAAEARRNERLTRINQALAFARDDTRALEAGERALQSMLPDRPAELLLADSSRAHFDVALRTHRDDGLPACGVPTPADCPAAARGQAIEFPTSQAFDACPYLRDRPGEPRSALCIPVSISGSAEGVLHSTGDDGVAVDLETRHVLDTVAHRLGERIGVLRAFRQTELQASTDPLTGLANRRSFEEAVAAELNGTGPVAVAFGDIDHFKALNDTYGHDTGDRALRVFARLFRDVLRPDDLVCRWGGEEFVIAFRGLDGGGASAALQRLRSELRLLVAAGTIPAFTVSFGVADRGDGGSLEELVRAADRALLAAKRAGRDRIVLASDPRVEELTSAAEVAEPLELGAG